MVGHGRICGCVIHRGDLEIAKEAIEQGTGHGVRQVLQELLR